MIRFSSEANEPSPRSDSSAQLTAAHQSSSPTHQQLNNNKAQARKLYQFLFILYFIIIFLRNFTVISLQLFYFSYYFTAIILLQLYLTKISLQSFNCNFTAILSPQFILLLNLFYYNFTAISLQFHCNFTAIIFYCNFTAVIILLQLFN